MVSQLLRIIGLDSEFNNLNSKAPAGSAMSILEMVVRIKGYYSDGQLCVPKVAPVLHVATNGGAEMCPSWL